MPFDKKFKQPLPEPPTSVLLKGEFEFFIVVALGSNQQKPFSKRSDLRQDNDPSVAIVKNLGQQS